DADDRDAGGAAPLVAQVALGADIDAPGAELLVELMDEPLEVSSRQLEAKILDAGTQERLALGTQGRLCAIARVGLLALVEDGWRRWSCRLGPRLGRGPLLHDRSGLCPRLRRGPFGHRRRRRLRRLLLLCLGCGGGGGHGGQGALTIPAGGRLPPPRAPLRRSCGVSSAFYDLGPRRTRPTCRWSTPHSALSDP